MPSHYQGSSKEKLALTTFIKLIRAAESIATRINNHLSEHNLTVSQFGVLEAVYHLGPMHQNQLAEKILRSTGNMTLVIDNLVKRNLVERRRDEDDRRCVNIHLTPAGQALIAEIFPAHVQTVVQEFSVLTPAEQVQLGQLCRTVGVGQLKAD
jgi:MarR family 2-MHQ and catechol resistance regulon transcriptional repressor